MKILLDMNLPPRWVEALQHGGWEAIHWSQVGDPRAADEVIMEWARQYGFVIFTHDLDYGKNSPCRRRNCLHLTEEQFWIVLQSELEDHFALSPTPVVYLLRHTHE